MTCAVPGLPGEVDAFQVGRGGGMEGTGGRNLRHAVGDDLPVLRGERHNFLAGAGIAAFEGPRRNRLEARTGRRDGACAGTPPEAMPPMARASCMGVTVTAP